MTEPRRGAACDGEWRERFDVPNEGDDLTVFSCSGCGEFLIVLRGRGFTQPADLGLEGAVRASLMERAG